MRRPLSRENSENAESGICGMMSGAGKLQRNARACGADLQKAVRKEFSDGSQKQFHFCTVETAQSPCLSRQLAVTDELSQGNLFCLGGSLIVAAGNLLVGFGQFSGQNHETDSDGGQQKSGERPDIDHMFSAVQAEQRWGGFLQIDKFIFKIIFQDQRSLRAAWRISSRRREIGMISPHLGHMSRSDIDAVTVFVSISDFKTVVPEHGNSLEKGIRGKGYGFFRAQKRTENVQEALTPAPTTIS